MGLLYSLGGDQQFQELEMKFGQPFLPSSKRVDFSVKQHANKLNEFLYNLLFFTELPRLLHYTDMNSMFHSIESRVPFLDHRLVELLFQMSPDLKVEHGITKAVMREGLRDILPEKIYSRKDKIGFKTPGETTWLRSLLLKGALRTQNDAFEGINLSKATRVLDQYKAGDNKHATMAWRLVFLNQWVTKHG
jgi:asparagine synthase (glutamine-hydrolysing)